MADGDAAAAIGLAILTGIEKVKDMWKQINATRDMIANHITSGAHTASQITSGVLDVARLPTDIPGSSISGPVSLAGGTSAFDAVSVGGTGAGIDSAGNAHLGAIYTPSGRSTPVASSYVAAYLNGDGRIGATPSSFRFKKKLNDYVADVDAFMRLKWRRYTYRADKKQTPRLGMWAEDLNAEFPELVVHENGKPYSIHKEDFFAVLGSIIQQQEARIRELEKKAADNA